MTDRNVISNIVESLFEDWINKNINFHPLAIKNMRILEADALALLKEQDAVKPTKANNPDESEYCCGICGYPLWLDELYCAHCGRRIKWEGW